MHGCTLDAARNNFITLMGNPRLASTPHSTYLCLSVAGYDSIKQRWEEVVDNVTQ